MKLVKKAVAVAVAAALSCIVFAACGSNDPADSKTYTVNFDANGGTLVSESTVTVEQGKSITLPAATQEGFTLEGWYLGTELAGIAGASYTPAGNVTLKAEWEADTVLPDYAAINGERAIEYAKVIEELYWDSDTRLSKLTPAGGAPYLWPYTEQAGMVNGILLSMDKTDEDYDFFKGYLEELLYGLRYYRVRTVTDANWQNENCELVAFGETDGTANSYAIYNSGRNSGAIDSVSTGMGSVFFDDNIWVAKEFYYAYLNLGEEKYLNEAINIVNWIVGEGYESTKGLNGIYWNWSARYRFEYGGNNGTSLDDSYHASLNACSSAPTAMMLAKLYQTLGEEKFSAKFSALATDYFAKAQNIYTFCYNTLRNTANGCLRDKIFLREGFETQTDKTKQIEMYDEQILPYNTGTFMTAGAELYNIAVAQGKSDFMKFYLDRNKKLAADADKEFANTQVVQGQYSYHQNSWFTSFILEGFIDLSESVEECEVYIEHMRSSLEFAWTNHRAEDKLVCPAWISGWSVFSDNSATSEGNPRQILLQSANAHCYAMLARYYAK